MRDDEVVANDAEEDIRASEATLLKPLMDTTWRGWEAVVTIADLDVQLRRYNYAAKGVPAERSYGHNVHNYKVVLL